MPSLGASPPERQRLALLDHDRAVLVAPAGCGKTEVIAKALQQLEGRHLVLTHTHAGVGALRERLSRLRVPNDRARVETIASFALRLAAGYPALSGLDTARPTRDQWNDTYPAAARLLATRVGRSVVERSYDSIFVDEYQDCIESQHQLVLHLAELLPCRVVGDPLQAIFDFGENRVVSWERDVFPNFERVPDLDVPWRWRSNRALGQWLLSIRQAIESGRSIDTSGSPVRWRALGQERAACFDIARLPGSAVALRYRGPQCHQLAQQLGGLFSSMEEMDCHELRAISRRLQALQGGPLVEAVVQAAATCMTKVTASLRPIITAIEAGRSVSTVRPSRLGGVVAQLVTVEAVFDARAISAAIREISRLDGVIVFRRELLGELHRTLALFAEGREPSLEDAAWIVRNRTRLAGRLEQRRVVSRTLLVKGLEFDHAVLANADELNAKNLYVALTRGSKTVTVVSESPVLVTALRPASNARAAR